MAAYYNEHDPQAAQWLRNLIAAGLIAGGDVDERSIVDVRPDDLRGFAHCHFFAGIGTWSYALRGAGWADDRPVWTGSCPCQPFSAAGKGNEFADERHLWPAWFRLIRECRPHVVFGEQVSSKDALAWFDHVSTDLEGAGYAVGALDTCAAGVGAPHIRQRLYFVGHAEEIRRVGRPNLERERSTGQRERCRWREPSGSGDALRVADAERGAAERHGFQLGAAARRAEGARPQRKWIRDNSKHGGVAGALAHDDGAGSLLCESDGQSQQPALGASRWNHADGRGAVNGFWRDAVWLPCRDGKARPVEPGTFPLVDGTPARVVRLRGYGNAICAPQATAFVEAYLDACRAR